MSCFYLDWCILFLLLLVVLFFSSLVVYTWNREDAFNGNNKRKISFPLRFRDELIACLKEIHDVEKKEETEDEEPKKKKTKKIHISPSEFSLSSSPSSYSAVSTYQVHTPLTDTLMLRRIYKETDIRVRINRRTYIHRYTRHPRNNIMWTALSSTFHPDVCCTCVRESIYLSLIFLAIYLSICLHRRACTRLHRQISFRPIPVYR